MHVQFYKQELTCSHVFPFRSCLTGSGLIGSCLTGSCLTSQRLMSHWLIYYGSCLTMAHVISLDTRHYGSCLTGSCLTGSCLLAHVSPAHVSLAHITSGSLVNRNRNRFIHLCIRACRLPCVSNDTRKHIAVSMPELCCTCALLRLLVRALLRLLVRALLLQAPVNTKESYNLLRHLAINARFRLLQSTAHLSLILQRLKKWFIEGLFYRTRQAAARASRGI